MTTAIYRAGGGGSPADEGCRCGASMSMERAPGGTTVAGVAESRSVAERAEEE